MKGSSWVELQLALQLLLQLVLLLLTMMRADFQASRDALGGSGWGVQIPDISMGNTIDYASLKYGIELNQPSPRQREYLTSLVGYQLD